MSQVLERRLDILKFRAGHLFLFSTFSLMKNAIFEFLLIEFDFGAGYFNKPSPEVDYLHSEIGLELIFCRIANPMCPAPEFQ